MSASNETLVEDLKEKYALSDNPFSPRLRCFYDGAQRKHNLEVLRHMAIFGDMVLALTGEHGAGKSSIVAELSRRFSDEISVVSIAVTAGSDRASSMERLATISGLELPGKHPPRDVLEHLIDQYSASHERTGKRTLIVIDDAHALPNDELMIYLNVVGGLEPESGVSLLLVGLPSLTTAMMAYKNPDKEEWMHQLHLKPLSENETEEYMRCRMVAAGFGEGDFLDPKQLSKLAELGQGMPGAINSYFPYVALGQVEFLDAETERRGVRSAQVALFGIAGALVLSFVFVAYQHGMLSFDGMGLDSELDLTTQPNPKEAEELARVARLAQIEAALQATGSKPESMIDESKANKVKESIAEASKDTESEAKRSQKATDSAEESSAIVPDALAGEPVLEARVEGERTNDLQDTPGADSLPMAKAAINHEAQMLASLAEEPAAESRSSEKKKMTPAEASLVDSPQAKAEVKGKKVSVEAEPADVAQLATPEDAKRSAFYRGRSWLLSRPDTHFTAQVLGSYSEKTARNFAVRVAKQGDEVVYVESTYKGRIWYVVLFGSFESKKEGRQALGQAGQMIQKQQPWLRSFSGLKASIQGT